MVKTKVSSEVCQPLVILTVALSRLVSSTSLSVRPASTTTGVEATLLPSVKAVLPAEVVSAGASFTAATFTVLVTILELSVPSLTW